MAVNYLEMLQRRLGFKCKDLEQLVPVEVGFTGMIYEMERCANGTNPKDKDICQCQMGVGAWMKTGSRYGRVHFLPIYTRDELKTLVHLDNTKTSIQGAYFLTTFTPAVWALVAGLFFTFTILKMMDMRFDPPDASYVPLDKSEPVYRRVKNCLLKSRILFRIRKAGQSTSTLNYSSILTVHIRSLSYIYILILELLPDILFLYLGTNVMVTFKK